MVGFLEPEENLENVKFRRVENVSTSRMGKLASTATHVPLT